MRNRRQLQLWRRIRLRIHKKFNLNFERIQSREGCKTNENGLQLISVQSFLDGDFFATDSGFVEPAGEIMDNRQRMKMWRIVR